MDERVRTPKCIISTCDGSASTKRYRFPIRDNNMKRIWLQRINNKDIMLFTDNELYNKVFLCGDHFLDISKGKRKLAKNALPTINMPGFHEEPTIENSFYYETTARIDSTIAVTSSGINKSAACSSGTPLVHESVIEEQVVKVNRKYINI